MSSHPSDTTDARSPGAGSFIAPFVTFEGIDGSGKSTQLERLAARLAAAGVPHRVTQEPGGTPLGEAIRGVFLDPSRGTVDGTVELLLVFASRRQHLLETIDPALDRGEIVLCDRFTDSTLAYQGFGRGVDRATIDAVDRVATGGRRPDRTVLFDLDPEQAARRRGADGPGDRLDREARAFRHRVRDGFLELAAAEPERFRVVDASDDVDAVARRVEEALGDLLGRPASARPASDAGTGTGTETGAADEEAP